MGKKKNSKECLKLNWQKSEKESDNCNKSNSSKNLIMKNWTLKVKTTNLLLHHLHQKQSEVAKEVIQVPLRQLKKRVKNPDHGPPDLKPETQSTDEIPETEIVKQEAVARPEVVVENVGIQLPHPLQTRLNQISLQVGTTDVVVEVFLNHQGTIEGAK